MSGWTLTGLEEALDRAEAGVKALRPGCQKQVRWAGASEVQTPLSVVFLHGFSASCGELRPLPEDVAAGLGANLFATRLQGHGRDGPAMAEASLAGWRADVAEALAIGAVLGERVLVIGCSTGCTLAADALMRGMGADVAGVVFISPNFGLRHKWAQRVLDLPLSHLWAPAFIGRERSFPVHSPAHAQFWTVRYPTRAVKPMADAVRAVRRGDMRHATAPLLMALNPDDQVIDPVAARRMLRFWGGPAELVTLRQTPDDDEMGHVMAGDVFSPGQTAGLVARITGWAKNL